VKSQKFKKDIWRPHRDSNRVPRDHKSNSFPFEPASLVYFMFCCPCISIHLCNKNQLDALFILSLFRQSTSTYFGNICSPSSGGI